jgi:hypothetical protein
MCGATRDVRFGPIADIRLVHSITPSARASSVGGTSRPSALAVLSLINNSTLVGNATGRSPGLLPLQDFVDVVGRAVEARIQIDAVADETARFDVLAAKLPVLGCRPI